MVLGGHNVQKLVESNVYRGLEATLKFNTWKRTCAKAAKLKNVTVEV